MTLEMKDLDHVIKLSHLSIEEAEKPKYLKQLQDVLETMKEMDNIDLSGLTPATHANCEKSVLREDIVSQPDDLLKEQNAPHWEPGGFSVPQILGGE